MATYSFKFKSAFNGKRLYSELRFYLDRSGKLKYVRRGNRSGFFPQFTAANFAISFIKKLIEDDPDLRTNEDLMDALEDADARKLLSAYLRIADSESVLARLAPKAIGSNTCRQWTADKSGIASRAIPILRRGRLERRLKSSEVISLTASARRLRGGPTRRRRPLQHYATNTLPKGARPRRPAPLQPTKGGSSAISSRCWGGNV